MNQLKSQIREAFFNPILYFLPSLVFILVNEFWGVSLAWKFSFPVAFALVFYMFYNYKRVFFWHGIFATIYFFVGFAATLTYPNNMLHPIADKLTLLFLLLMIMLHRKNFEQLSKKAVQFKIPMANNARQLKQTSKKIAIGLSIYIVSLFLLYFISSTDIFADRLLNAKIIFSISILIYILYETTKVRLVRYGLAREDWLPIVDEDGNVTGSVQYQPDAVNAEKLMHPVVRFYFLKNKRLLLQQRCASDRSEPMLWDATISHKVRLNETMDDSLQENARKMYGLEILNPMFLTTYIHEGNFCKNYISLFVSCRYNQIEQPQKELLTSKWWTIVQIENNLEAGIFTKRFEIEYEILKRSGLIATERFCECECTLRDTYDDLADKGISAYTTT